MELTHHSLIGNGPKVRAWALTWLWEPEPGTGERIAALISFQPDPSSEMILSPGTYVLLPKTRLGAMMGRVRAESAYGILKAAADFMTHRLLVGATIDECAPPFQGFQRGAIRQVLAFNADQLIDAAVRGASSFGHSDEIVDELVVEPNHSTETTRAFLERVKTSMAPKGDERRSRFGKRIQFNGANMTIDYAHQKNLVQFVSTPRTDRQQQNMLREAKAKLFEAAGVAKYLFDSQGQQILVVNTSVLHEDSKAGLDVASATLEQFRQLAGLNGTRTVEAPSHVDAVRALSELE
jgi:hypothetical protein